MTYWFIGISVGIIMGLTGAGGSLISIPLFIYLLNTSLKEATVLSLMAVIFGALVSLLGNHTKINLKYILFITVPGIIANFLSLPLKAMSHNSLIIGMLFLISIYSLFGIWKEKKTDRKQSPPKHTSFTFIWIGVLLGITTTFTGLGGGVILLPLLIQMINLSYEEALPISLATIAVISLMSFIFQWESVFTIISLLEIFYILAGTISSYFLLNLFMKGMKKSKILFTRKIVFTLVALYSVTSVFMTIM